MARSSGARYRQTVMRRVRMCLLVSMVCAGCAGATTSTRPTAAADVSAEWAKVPSPPLQPRLDDSGWTRVSSALRVRLFAVRREYCAGEPIDVVMLIHNTSPEPVKIRSVRLAPEVGMEPVAQARFSLAIRWRRERHVIAPEQQLPLRRAPRLMEEQLSRRLLPGSLRSVSIRLRQGRVPQRKMRKRAPGEPDRREVELLGRPTGRLVLEATWAPNKGDTAVRLPPVRVRVHSTRPSSDACPRRRF